MKKIYALIIFIFATFSIQNVFASEGYIEQLLNLNYGPIEYDIGLVNINSYSFKNKDKIVVYNKLKNYDKILKSAIIQKFEEGTLDYNTMNSVTNNYSTYVYYINEFLYLLKMSETNPKVKKDTEFQNSFSDNYKNIGVYFQKIKTDILD